jgi:para-nitrobenzyl esterase
MTHRTRLARQCVAAAIAVAIGAAMSLGNAEAAQVKLDSGAVEGTATSDGRVKIYKGIPYGAPPTGNLRWQPPRPVVPWVGVRKAIGFGPRCMQGRIYDDMVFRDGMSEDCLYLNVWTPARGANDRLAVMVWIHGGGFQTGSASEPRQDGEMLARRNVVVVSMNYRLGVFGFLGHPELSREIGPKTSGNYGLHDLIASLQWVKANIGAFGGDPNNVTIFGESAGSIFVSALMASPLARGLFHKAIGESGALFPTGPGFIGRSLAESEEQGAKFASSLGAETMAALRAKPAEEVLQTALKTQPWFAPTIDGNVLPESVAAIYDAGKQARVPLLAGWNADEARAGVVLGKEKPSIATFTQMLKTRFGDGGADAVLKAYPASSDEEALESQAAFASDMFIGYGTWKWIEEHTRTGKSPVYRYSFNREIPVATDAKVNGNPATAKDIGARHAGEIEYVFGTLDSMKGVKWTDADRDLSSAMMTYWTNFAKTGNPNGRDYVRRKALPAWPRYDEGERHVIQLDEAIASTPDQFRSRYVFLDTYLKSRKP